MPSILQKLRDKSKTRSEKKALLREVKAEAYKHERTRVKLEDKKRKADAFLREVEKAEKAGIEKARVGGKTYSVKALIQKGKHAKELANKGMKAVDRGLAATSKVLDNINLDDNAPKKKRVATKKKVPVKKKTSPQKRSTAKTKQKPKTKKRKPISDRERTRRAIASGK